MAKRKHLIIGCGAAALAALRKIRAISSDDEVVMVTREEYLPYSPAALPYIISGRITEKDLWLVDEHYLSSMGCSLLKGKEVTEVHPEQKQVTYKDGGRESYDTLLVASGSRPVTPEIPGLDEVGFAAFHTISDCRRLQQQLKDKKQVAIYGGGLVAVELAAALLEAGYSVQIIVRSRLLRSYFDPDAGDMIEDILKNRGARIIKGSEIKEIKKSSKGIVIALADGNSLDTDMIAIALGVNPSAPFLNGSGVKINDGILVDRKMMTNIADIYAAGDVTESPDFFTGNPGVNPILPGAVKQGAIAGSNMAGDELEYEGWIPMNILNLLGHQALSIGMLDGNGFQILTDKDDRKKQYRKLALKDGRLVGAAFIDVDLVPGTIQYLIRKRIDVGQDAELLLRKPKETGTRFMLKAEKQETMSLEG